MVVLNSSVYSGDMVKATLSEVLYLLRSEQVYGPQYLLPKLFSRILLQL